MKKNWLLAVVLLGGLSAGAAAQSGASKPPSSPPMIPAERLEILIRDSFDRDGMLAFEHCYPYPKYHLEVSGNELKISCGQETVSFGQATFVVGVTLKVSRSRLAENGISIENSPDGKILGWATEHRLIDVAFHDFLMASPGADTASAGTIDDGDLAWAMGDLASQHRALWDEIQKEKAQAADLSRRGKNVLDKYTVGL